MLDRIRYFQQQIAQLRKVETNLTNYRLSVSGYLAELDRMNLEVREYGIEYNVIGAIALNQHGYQRFTVDIDLLLSKEGLEKFHAELVGRGYRPAFEGARKKFHSADRNVPIEIITTGEYPG